MRRVTPGELDRLSAKARELPRRRLNLNLHASPEEACQRLFNAVEPGSYIRPHRHLSPPKPEVFIPVRGRFAVLLFTEAGELAETVLLGGPGDPEAVEVRAGDYHAVLSLETGSIFFEAKPGPYRPLDDKDWAPWSPPEGSAEAASYLARLEAGVSGLLGRARGRVSGQPSGEGG